jgi:flagellar hook-length control protein FliK
MTPLAVLTAAPAAVLPASAGAAATATSPPGGFARCLERAHGKARPETSGEPATTPTGDAAAARRGSDDGATAADGSPPAEPGNQRASDTDDEAVAATAPDLSLLLPGWPPAAAAIALPPTVGAATTPTLAVDDGAVAAAAPLAAAASITAAGVEDRARTVGARDAAPRTDPGTALAATNDAAPAMAASASVGHGRDVGNRDAAGQHEGAGADALVTPALQPGAEPRAPAAEATAVPSLSSAPSAVATTAHAKAAETAAATALVAAAIDTPSFAPSLASQLRWWASEGVQQAQLQLNPADMGPVAVRIVVDGREARIDFSADLPATRSALESALPVLAAALDEGGLKLTGGGVHDGAAQRQAAWQAPAVTQRTNGGTGLLLDDAGAAKTASRGAAARGLVDLVA